ncbi:N-acetylmuramoyl-L-alanine amidase [Candidatus Uhrbacteria bacterium]|nr:N-acetylmuramoyl-L-alanine amidase [Candidatus Uhrbacteria bacterium]
MNRSTHWFFIGLCAVWLIGGGLFVFAQQPFTNWEKRINPSEFHCHNTACETGEIAIPLDAQTLGLSVQHGDVLEVRLRDEGGWTGWMRVEGETDAPDFEKDSRPYALYVSRGIRALRIRAPLGGQHDIDVVALSSPTGTAKDGRVTIAAVTEGPQSEEDGIISRESWLSGGGAFSENEQQILWSPHYAQPKKIVIHHTATIVRDMNGDGIIDRSDYRDAIRAIYSFHARSRRWGDIGYNYIIAPDGSVWEGRGGGDGIVAGHTVRSASCTKFTKAGVGFNDGSIGIAVLGTYTSDGISFAAVNALTDLIAEKSWEFGIHPSGSGFFKDAVYPNVLGHRDLDCTSCPGESMHWVLSDIVRMAQKAYEKLVESKPRQYKAELVDIAPRRVLFHAGEKEKEVIVRFKNTGIISWRNYGDESLRIARADIAKKLSALDTVRMATVEDQKDEEVNTANKKEEPASSYVVATLLAPNVAPGQTGAFRLRFTVPNQFIGAEKFVLAVGERGWLSGTEYTIETVNGNRPLAALLENKDARAFSDDWDDLVSFEFRNMGTESWKRGEVVLSIRDAELFRTTKWKNDDGQFVFEEKTVGPGEMAHFNVPARFEKPGRSEFKPALLKLKKKEVIEGSDLSTVLATINPARIVEVDTTRIPPAVLAAWRPVFSVRIKNNGEKQLKNVTLVAADNEKKSAWYHRSWNGKTIIESVKEIKPGESATMLFRVTPPQKAGSHELKLSLRADGKQVYSGSIDSYSPLVARVVRVDEQKK